MKFSLVLATYGRVTELTRLVESLCAQTHKDFEVIVVDQNLDDRIVPYINIMRDNGLEVEIIKQQTPNLSLARNAGLKLSRGEVVAFPDDDCWYDVDCLSAIKNAFFADCDADFVIAKWHEQAAGQNKKFEGTVDLDAWRKFRAGAASSISLFVRRQALISTGGFDKRFGVGRWYGSGEETDLVFRLLLARYKAVRNDAAVVHHRFVVSNSVANLAEWINVVRRSRGTGALYAKHSLSFFTIARGLISPFLRAGQRIRSSSLSAYYLGQGVGRSQGYLGWIFNKSKSDLYL